MRIRALAAVAMAATVLETFSAQQQAPPQRPFGRGMIEVQVTRTGTTEGIPEVAVTLQGPIPSATAEQVSQLFTPSSSLSAAQRQQVDQLLQEAYDTGITSEGIANAASRLEAQLLGQPQPAALPLASLRPNLPADITVTTDLEGRVSFPSLPPGRYTIRAQRDNYYGPTPGGGLQPPMQVNQTVTLKETDQEPARVAIAMTPGVVLSGRVRDPEGRPMPGMMITAQQPVYQSGATLLNPMNQAPTDDRGLFRMFGLPPGEYYVSATPRQRANAPASPQDTWAKTFFPGVVDARQAVPVKAPAGGELSGINFDLQAAATGRITGRIINPFKGADGKPTTPSSTLFLIPQGQNLVGDTNLEFNVQNVAQERSNGEFEIRSILPGLYDLLVSAPTGAASAPLNAAAMTGGPTTFTTFGGSGPVSTAWGRVRVNVGKEDLNNVTLAIKAGQDVQVRVVVDGAPPPFTMAAPTPARGIDSAVVNALVARGISRSEAIAATRGAAAANLPPQVPTPRVRLSLQTRDNSPYATSQASFDPSGLYVFPSVPAGNYRVQVSQLPAPEAYVADIRLGGASVYDDGVLIDGPLPGDIEVAIVSKGGRIQGTVGSIENRPAANAVIALIPAEARRRNPALYKTARSAAAGTFSINGVAPGIYKLFAWEDAPNTAWMNPEFLSRYEQFGEPVTITGGESLNTQVKVIPKNYGR